MDRYFIPCNKVVIEVTRDIAHNYRSVIYESNGKYFLRGRYCCNEQYCFMVVRGDPRGYNYVISHHRVYDSALEAFNNACKYHSI